MNVTQFNRSLKVSKYVDGHNHHVIEEIRMKSVRDRLSITCTALLFAVATVLPVALFSSDAAAQEITSSISGTVLQANGSPAAGASTATIRSWSF